MIPAPFRYCRPRSLAEALDVLAADEEAKPLAGGQSLLPLMKLRLAAPTTLVDLAELAELRGVLLEDGIARIGALTRHHDLSSNGDLRAHLPLLGEVAAGVGDPQVRHRGTIGGSCAHADPSADLPAALLALDASFVVASATGRRSVAANEFFTGFLETALAPGELLVAVEVPTGVAAGAFLKFTRRRIDWATVAVAAVRRGGSVAVSLANMGMTPLRARGVEAALAAGEPPSAAAERVLEGTAPSADVTASAAYRSHLARVLTRRCLSRLG
jgi:carbon-monoxide dehydrogenase medium subunit